MSLPRYPAYKDSGVSWQGEVPAHWEVIRLKKLIRYVESGVSVNAIDVPAVGSEIGVLKTSCVSAGFFDAAENKAVLIEEYDRVSCPVRKDTLIVSRMNTPTLVGAAGLVTQDYPDLFLPDRLWQVGFKDFSTAFIHYWTQNKTYRAQVEMACSGTSSSMQNLGQDQFGNFWLARPLADEAVAIAGFLDRETAKIDVLIAKQEKLIALLAEKRQATISHAVTRGLDPNVPLKDSGVPWLGKVPAHWATGTLARISERVVVGIAEAATHAYRETGVPILRSTNVRAGKLVGELLYIAPEFAADRSSKLISAGDLVTVRTGNAGVTVVIPPELDQCQCFTMLITTLRQKQLASYYCYWMNSEAAVRYFQLEGWGTAQVNISVPILKALPVVIPPLSEQEAIMEFLNSETNKLDALSQEAHQAIQLLLERRAALISAAITGKIDVRGLVA